VKGLSDSKLRRNKSGVIFRLSNSDFVDEPKRKYDEVIKPIRKALSTGFVRDRSLDDCKYTGGWLNDLPNGFGMKVYPEGQMEQGIIYNGKFTSYLKINEENGAVMTGFMHKGKKHGIWKSEEPQSGYIAKM
jgi:hypothetical protein